jgi:hypothetical protein
MADCTISKTEAVVVDHIQSEPNFKIDIDGKIFAWEGSETKLVIPAQINGIKVTKIGESVFRNRKLTSVIIPEGVTAINYEAFRDNRLTSVIIPASVSYIGHRAFADNRLVSVIISSDFISIEDHAFTANNKLTSITIGADIKLPRRYVYNSPFTFNGDFEYFYDVNGKKAGTYTFGDNGWKITQDVPHNDSDYLTSDENGTVTGYTGLKGTGLVIPEYIGSVRITAIKEDTFKGMGLTIVTIPDSITTIGENAFSRNRLNSVTISAGITSISSRLFYDNRLTEVVILEGVTSIGDWAFGSNHLTSVIIPTGVTSIGDNSFSHNRLSSVTIPESVTSIGDWAFYDNSLTSVTIPANITSINDGVFHSNILTSVIIPDTVISISVDAFTANKLVSITIGDNVSIGYFSDSEKCERYYPSFSKEFDGFYNDNGKKAGTYILDNEEWNNVR